MNCMLGGAALALLARWRQGTNQYGNRIFFDVAKKVPVLLAATISLGIAPLLFVQVLYGQYFYTSSILLAWPWFLVIVFLIAAYYGFYFVSYRGERRPRAAGRVMLFSTTLVLIIGFIYTNNITLGLVPSRWAQKYFSGASGWHLNLSEPTLFPRYLHFMTAAVAVGGLLLVLIAWAKWKQDSEYARAVFQFGGKAFMYATMAQFPSASGFSSACRAICACCSWAPTPWPHRCSVSAFLERWPPSTSCPMPCAKTMSATPPSPFQPSRS
jgi:hypothetical protein